MSLPYVSPERMAEYRSRILLFSKGAHALSCVSSHYLPETNGTCDLMQSKDHDAIFVVANRAGHTLKVCEQGLQIIANIIEIEGLKHWFDHLIEHRHIYRERLAHEEILRQEERRAAAKSVLIRKRKPNVSLDR
jgi:hypothetical protein